jgi:prephenate dehydrogenase
LSAGARAPHWDTVAIIGVGLMGGSIGLALKERRLARRVVGVGRRQESLDRARAAGAIDEGVLELEAAVAHAELIIACTPVGRIVEDVTRAARACPAGALLTDAGSTKQQIVARLDGKLPGKLGTARFVGSHPLAGSEKNGPQNARADLYEGRLVLVTPGKKSAPADVQATCDFWSALGASVWQMSPLAHDKALANTSHMPHLVSAALAGATPPEDRPLCGTGWRDTTRIAGGDVEVWTQIFLANQQNTLKSLARFEKTLSAMRAALERGDETRLAKLLTEAKQNRDALGS